LVVAEKELHQARKYNQVLARYINAKRKNEEAQKKADEEAARKRWRAKATRMSELGGSTPLRVVQGFYLLLLAFVKCLLVHNLL
jgi:hypothetical protein